MSKAALECANRPASARPMAVAMATAWTTIETAERFYVALNLIDFVDYFSYID